MATTSSDRDVRRPHGFRYNGLRYNCTHAGMRLLLDVRSSLCSRKQNFSCALGQWSSRGLKLSVRGACMHARRFCQTQLTHTDPGKTGNHPDGAKIQEIRDTGSVSPAGTARYGSTNINQYFQTSSGTNNDWIIKSISNGSPIIGHQKINIGHENMKTIASSIKHANIAI